MRYPTLEAYEWDEEDIQVPLHKPDSEVASSDAVKAWIPPSSLPATLAEDPSNDA